jgi:putative transposase
VTNNQTEYPTMTRRDSNESVAKIKALMAEDSRTSAPDGAHGDSGVSGSGDGGGDRRAEGRAGRKAPKLSQRLLCAQPDYTVEKLELRVPQDHNNGRFSTEIFERYQRSEKEVLESSSSLQPNR